MTTTPRHILRNGDRCTAFVVLDGSGSANIHIIRPGAPPLTVLGAAVTKQRTDKKEV